MFAAINFASESWEFGDQRGGEVRKKWKGKGKGKERNRKRKGKGKGRAGPLSAPLRCLQDVGHPPSFSICSGAGQDCKRAGK